MKNKTRAGRVLNSTADGSGRRAWRVALQAAMALAFTSSGSGALAANFDCTWASAANGNWNAAGSWSACNSAFPNNGADTFNALINQVGAAYTTTLNTSATIGTLTLDSVNATFSHSAGTLTAAAININNGTYNLAGGTIVGATIDGTGGLFQVPASSTLNGAKLNRSLNVGNQNTGAGVNLTILNGLTLDHAAGESLNLFTSPSQTAALIFNTGTLGSDIANGKTGTVVLAPNGTSSRQLLLINPNQTLTIGAGITVKTNFGAGDARAAITGNTNSTLLNAGTISSETAGGLLTISPTNTTNTGILAAKNGGILTMAGNWTNTNGTFSLDANAASTLNLDGTFDTADLGTFSRGVNGLNGVVNLTGTLTNTGETLLLNNTTGSFNLAGGTILGGTIDTAAGSASALNVTTNAGGTLNGVTLLSSLNVGNQNTSSVDFTILNGLTLDHAAGESLNLFTSPFQTAALIFNTGTLGSDIANGKTGTVVLAPNGTNSRQLLLINTNQTLTIDAGITVKTNFGAGGTRAAITGNTNSTLLNAGTISSETAGRLLTISPTNTTNTGILAAKNGGILTMAGNWTNTNGTFSLDANAASTLNLDGTFDTADLGTFSRGVNGLNGVVNLTGTLTNTGETLLLNNTTGSFNLAGGTILGGFIDVAPGSASVLKVANSGIFDAVTLLANQSVGSATDAATLQIDNGLTLDHDAGEALTLNHFTGSSSIRDLLTFGTSGTLGAVAGKTGVINLVAGSGRTLDVAPSANQTVTIGSGVAMKLADSLGNARIVGGANNTLLNQGTLSSESSGRTFSVLPTSLTNTGILAAKNGGILTIAGNWTNTNGTFSLDANAASTLNLGGTFDTADLGTFSRGVNGTNGIVNLTGALNNTGALLELNDTTGSLNLNTGSITGGIIDVAAGSASKLNIIGSSSNILDGVTLRSNLNVGSASANAAITVSNLTLDHEAGEALTFTNVSNSNVNGLLLNTGTLGAEPGKTGTITLSPTGSSLSMLINVGQAVTFGEGLIVKLANATGGSQINSSSTQALINNGTISSESSGRTLQLNARATNNGTLVAKNGGTLVAGPNLLNLDLVTSTLTGGTYQTFANSTLNFGTNRTFTTNAATILLDGAGSVFAAANPLATNNGSFTIQNGRNFSTVGALTNGGTLGIGPSSTLNIVGALTNNNHIAMNGGTLDATGTVTSNAPADITGFGTLNNTLLNHGLVRAAGGNLIASGGIDGQSGTLQIDPGATLTLGANSDGDFLINNGTLALGTSNVTVAQDYTNANFGTGNTFNARTNVTGTGQVLAAGDVVQAITGQVTGAGPNVTLTFGNVHVGDVAARTYQVANTGTTGPSLRGALQTTVNGGNLTDARLSGSGVTAGNFGPIAVGANSGDRTVTFSATAAGALTGQVLNIANNFDNVDDSEISIVNSAAFRFANPTAHTPEPINFNNRHVGDVVSQVLSITNNVPNDGFSEALNASIGTATGAATTNGGSFNLLLPGLTNSTSLSVGLSTSTAGAKSGTAQIALTSDGTGSSGLGLTALAPQTVNVSGNVFRFADASTLTPNPVSLGNRHVGDVAEQTLLLSNLAANDSFSESLNAAFGTLAGNATASGSVSLLAAGSNSSALTVGINTASAGNKTGSTTVNFVSDGSGTSGLGQTSLNGVGNTVNEQQVVNVSGTVFRLASASAHTPEPVTLANARVGGTSTQSLSVTNTAANDTFSERLNASLSGATTGITASGSFDLLAAQGTNSSSLIVGLDTTSAGHKAGTATINLTSDGSGTSNLGTTALTSQTVNASGDVFRLATASAHSPEPVTLANARVGGTSTQILTLTNTAANDTFSEGLNASLSGATAGITAGGNFNLLAAQATNSTDLVVGLDTGSAGHKAGTATLNLASDGTGTSGFSALGLSGQTVNVNGDVFRLATASAHSPEPVAFGNLHVGDVVSQALSVSNTAANDGFSERLNASIGDASGSATTNGASFTQLAAGAPADTSLAVGLDTATAGAKSGAATITLASDGTGTSGFGAFGIGTQTVNVSGAVFRLAQANAVGDLNFGNVHVGDVLSQALTIQNLAATDGFSESLNASFGASSDLKILTSGSITQLAAGGLDNTSMFIGLDTTAAGIVDGTVGLNFASDGFGSSGLGVTALASQVINVDALITEAAVFRLANAQILNSQPIDFGKHRVGDVVGNIGLNIKNAVPADGFSESLNASAAGASAGFTASGSFSGLVAGATDSGSLAVGINTATAGHQVGTAQLALVSDGAGTSELGLTALPGQDVNLVGDIYRLAVGSTTSAVNIGNAHVGDSLSQSLSVTNTAANDGFSEALNASFSGTTGAASAVGVINLLGAGSTDTSNMVVNLDTATAGAKNGSATVLFASDGTGSSGFGALAAGSQTVILTGGVFGLAVAQSSTSDLDFAARRVGDLADSLVLTLFNDSANDGFHEGLDATYGLLPAAFQTSGNTTINNLAAGASTDATVTLSTATAGSFASTLNIDATSNGTLSGLASTALAPVAVNVSGKVYAQAVADVQTTSIDYGIVHKGDAVAARTIAVQNDASGALTDVLNGSVSASGAFSGAGTLSELAASQTNTSSLSVSLDTSAAGVFAGNAAVALASHNPDMLDLSLGNTLVALSAQVNEFASPVFTQTGGDGVLGVSNGTDFLLNFGTVLQGSVVLTSVLQMANDVSVPADTLRVELVGATSNFGLTGFGTFEVLAGDSHALSISFNPLSVGQFDDVLTLNLFGFNASGFDQQLGSFSLNLQANAVPLPAGVWLLGSALVGLVWAKRRTIRVAA